MLAGQYAWQEDGVLDLAAAVELPWIAGHVPGPSTMPDVHRTIT